MCHFSLCLLLSASKENIQFTAEMDNVMVFIIVCLYFTSVTGLQPIMLVNGIAINPSYNSYYYRNGDIVNVDCVSPNDRGYVQMSESIKPGTNADKIWGMGFSLKLTDIDNLREIQCTSYYPTLVSTTVKFEFRVKIANILNVEINDHDVTQRIDTSEDTYSINQGYFINHKEVKIRCYSLENYILKAACKNCIKRGEIIKNEDRTITLMPDMTSWVTCEVVSKYTNETEKQVKIGFTTTGCYDNSLLNIEGLNSNNILNEYHEYKNKKRKSLIYYIYQYNYKERIPLNCSRNTEIRSQDHTFINFNGTDLPSSENFIQKDVSLNLTHNNTKWTCSINNKNGVIMQIIVLFLLSKIIDANHIPPTPKSTSTTTLLTTMSSPIVTYTITDSHSSTILPGTSTKPTTEMSDSSPSEQKVTPLNPVTDETESVFSPGTNVNWLAIIVTVSILAVLICLLIVIFKIRKGNRDRLTGPDNSYDYCTTDAVLSYPTQSSSEYAVPESRIYDNSIYRRFEDLYTKVTPRSRRRFKPENLYANRSDIAEEDTELKELTQNDVYSVPTVNSVHTSDQSESIHYQEQQLNKNEVSPNLKLLSNVYSVPVTNSETTGIYMNVSSEPHYSNKLGGYCVTPTYSEPHSSNK